MLKIGKVDFHALNWHILEIAWNSNDAAFSDIEPKRFKKVRDESRHPCREVGGVVNVEKFDIFWVDHYIFYQRSREKRETAWPQRWRYQRDGL